MCVFWGVMHSFDAKLMLCIPFLLSSVDSIVDLRDLRIFEIIIITFMLLPSVDSSRSL